MRQYQLDGVYSPDRVNRFERYQHGDRCQRILYSGSDKMSAPKFFKGPVFILVKKTIDDGLGWDGSLEDFTEISLINRGSIVIFTSRAAAEKEANTPLRAGAVVGSFSDPNKFADFLEFAQNIGSNDIVIRPFINDRRVDIIGIDLVLQQLRGRQQW